jgi:hypothetical protein
MKILCVVLFSVLLSQEVPLKSKDEFQLKLDLQFKQREPESSNRVNFLDDPKRDSSTPLPYLTAELILLTVRDDEAKLKVVNNLRQTLINKKVDKSVPIKIDFGFTDDLKDHTRPHEYTILFYSKEKKLVRQIVVVFQEDGTYMVNGEKRGKI